MVKIFSILTLLISLAAAYLGLESKNLVEKLQKAADKEHVDLGRTRDDLKKTKDTLTKTEGDLEMTKAEWEKTKATLVTTQEEVTKTKGELDSTKTTLEETKTELAKAKKDLEDLVGKPGVKPEDLQKMIAEQKARVAELEGKVQTLEKQKAELDTTVETLTANKKELEGKIAPLNAQITKYKQGIIQEGLTGRVLAVNSGWGFCVLSIGDKQGAAANRVLVVSRDGQAIGRVRITSVETSQSVADIVPNSFAKGVYIQPGDVVIYRKGSEGVKMEEGDGAAGGGPAGGNTPPPAPELPIR